MLKEKIVNRFYNKPIVEETYNLDERIIEFLIPRLKLFVKESEKTIDWENSNSDLIPTVNKIINNLEYIKNFGIDDNNIEQQILKLRKTTEETFTLLGKILIYLGW